MGKPLRAHHSDRKLATISPFKPGCVRKLRELAKSGFDLQISNHVSEKIITVY